MIDPAISGGLARIGARQNDVANAYRAGFSPSDNSVAMPSRALPSNDPLSVVAPEGAYFAVSGTDGTLRLSRDGSFAVDDGELRAAGRPVLGVAFGGRAALGPLRVDAYDAALDHAADYRIDPDGTFSYARTTVDPRGGERRIERIAVGRIALARLPAGTQPERVDATHVRAPHGIVPYVGVPADGRFAALSVRARDLGGVDIVAGIEKMNDAYRSFEAIRYANHVRGSLEKTTMDLLK